MNKRQSVFPVLLATMVFWAGTGCGKAKREITELQRKQAAHLASEAQFALTMRDFPGAEISLAKAVELTPDDGALWLSLGAARMKQGKRGDAKDAYRGALRAFEAEAKDNKADSEPWLQQVHVLALLGQKDDGRALLEKTARQFPADRNVKLFVEEKQFDRLLEDPRFKEMAL